MTHNETNTAAATAAVQSLLGMFWDETTLRPLADAFLAARTHAALESLVEMVDEESNGDDAEADAEAKAAARALARFVQG